MNTSVIPVINATTTVVTEATLMGNILWVTTRSTKYTIQQIKNGKHYQLAKKHTGGNKNMTTEYTLEEIEPVTLAEYRKTNVPSFVYKKDGKLFWSKIPANLNFMPCNTMGSHLCAHECNHLSAAIDEHGGCAKVRAHAQRIENFTFIAEGYETFCTKHDIFTVLDCENYRIAPHRRSLPPGERRKLQRDLASLRFGVEISE